MGKAEQKGCSNCGDQICGREITVIKHIWYRREQWRFCSEKCVFGAEVSHVGNTIPSPRYYGGFRFPRYDDAHAEFLFRAFLEDMRSKKEFKTEWLFKYPSEEYPHELIIKDLDGNPVELSGPKRFVNSKILHEYERNLAKSQRARDERRTKCRKCGNEVEDGLVHEWLPDTVYCSRECFIRDTSRLPDDFELSDHELDMFKESKSLKRVSES